VARTAREAFAAIIVVGLVASLRFLSLTGFPDDHYVHLAGAQQMLHGEWPSRDFVDLGAPLTYGASAAAQAVFGTGQLTEAVFMAAMFGLAAAITLRAGVALTGSIALGLAVVVIEVLIFPRTYSYPKMLLYSAAALAVVWYAGRPSRTRIVLLAALTVGAFLIRHDHGVYVGIAALVAVALSPVPSDRHRGASSVALLCGAIVALTLPYLVYLQATGGVLPHIQRGLAFAALEGSRQRLTTAGLPVYTLWLLYAMWLAPATALVFIGIQAARRSEDARMNIRRVVPVIVLALVANAGLIRDALDTRLPDAVVPPALLMAWLVRQTWGPLPSAAAVAARAGGIGVLGVTIGYASVMGHTMEQLDRVGLFNGVARVPGRFAERAEELRRPWIGRQVPSEAARRLQPLFDYVDRCVGVEDRLLVPGFLPEVPVLARRAFAGGQVWFLPGALRTAEDHRLVMRRLRSERVPLAVVRRPTYDDLAIEFPELDAYIRERFSPTAQWSLGGPDTIFLLADASLAKRQDGVTGWPCFR
jgi:hypothetical protein